MKDASGVLCGPFASRLLRQFRERAGSRNEHVDELAAHASRNSPEGADCDAVFGFSPFELLDGLPGRVHFLSHLTLAKPKGFAHRGDPSAGGTSRQGPHEFKTSVQLRE